MSDIAITSIQLYVNSEDPVANAKLEEVYPRAIELAWRRVPFDDANLGVEVDERMTDDVGASVPSLDEFITFAGMDSSDWQVGASGQHEYSKVVRTRLKDGTETAWKIDDGSGSEIDVYARIEWVVVPEA